MTTTPIVAVTAKSSSHDPRTGSPNSTIAARMRELAFLNRGLQIVLEDLRSEWRDVFKYEGGITSFVEFLNANKTPLHPKPIYFEARKEDVIVEAAMQYNDGYSETIFSFANNINTVDGGTLDPGTIPTCAGVLTVEGNLAFNTMNKDSCFARKSSMEGFWELIRAISIDIRESSQLVV
jgi:DNA gyrase/topoisomerase IV subunit B